MCIYKPYRMTWYHTVPLHYRLSTGNRKQVTCEPVPSAQLSHHNLNQKHLSVYSWSYRKNKQATSLVGWWLKNNSVSLFLSRNICFWRLPDIQFLSYQISYVFTRR